MGEREPDKKADRPNNVLEFPLEQREGAYSAVYVGRDDDDDDPEAEASCGEIYVLLPHLSTFRSTFNKWKCGVLVGEGSRYPQGLKYLIDVHIQCLRCGYMFDVIGSEPANFKRLVDEYEALTAVVRAKGGNIIALNAFDLYLRDKMTAKALLQILRDGNCGNSEFNQYMSLRGKWAANPSLKDSLEVSLIYTFPPAVRRSLFDGAFVVGPDEIETFRDQASFNDLKAFAGELKDGLSRNIYLFLSDLRRFFPFIFVKSDDPTDVGIDGEQFPGVMKKLGSDLSFGELKDLFKRRILMDKGILRYVQAFYYGGDQFEDLVQRNIAAEWDASHLAGFKKLSLDLKNSGPNIEMWMAEARSGNFSNSRKLVYLLESLQRNPHFMFPTPPLARFGIAETEFHYIKSMVGCG